MRTMAIHAPEVNFVTAAMTKTMPYSTAPVELKNRLRCQ